MCVVRERRGPFYSLDRSVPAISLYGNISHQLQKEKISLPAKMHLDKCLSRFGRPHFAASSHRLSLVHCLVGPDVGMSVPGLRVTP